MWIQSLQKHGVMPANEEDRIYLSPIQGKDYELSICYAAIKLMEKELGGHSDKFDPYQIAIFYAPKSELQFKSGGLVHVGEGGHFTNESDEILNSFGYVAFKFPTITLKIGLPVPNLVPKIPLSVSTPFNWSAIDAVQFERLIFSTYDDDVNFENVEWLQHINAGDAGRDISAQRADNGNRILIQARHISKSVNEVDLNAVVTKAETWGVPFDEVIVSTTSTFTQNAIRWKELHNQKKTRPLVGLEAHSRLEVKLSRRPHLIAHLGLRI